MTDLLDFLRARLDDDEEAARDAGGSTSGRWARESYGCIIDAKRRLVVYGEGTPTREEAEHIARHDPARELREVEAKRRILSLHRCDDEGGSDPICNVCLYTPPCETIRALALPHSDHPDFDESWRP